ncbi:MAG TPA: GNAT family N-acetyltransferase [Kofleriaceae bacterium]|jgi:predicted acetyltransferase|nr:GNAT family N-acetyltransferase [Kofleriaceae bacterium]
MSRDIEVGVPKDRGELEGWARAAAEAFPMPPAREGFEWLERYDPADIRVVRVGGQVAGGAGFLPLGQYFGGRPVPMVGVHAVCILPEHRGTSAGSVLMKTAVAEMAANRVPLSTLYPATLPIYRRVGFESAGTQIYYSMPIAAIDCKDRQLEVERVGKDRVAELAEVHAQVVRHRAGNLERTPFIWRRILDPIKGEGTCLRVHRGGRTEGYVVFSGNWKSGRMKLDLTIRDFVALSPDAARRLWALIGDHRSIGGDVTFPDAPGAPSLRVLRDPVHSVDRTHTWMLRIIDVETALAARGYPAGLTTTLDLDIDDDLLPGNRGRFRLAVAGGSGRVERGEGQGSLRIDVRGLASLYSGYLPAQELRLHGLADGDADTLARASALFAGPAPWLVEMF